VNVVGTGDFTHPEWFLEMRGKLVEKEKGLYILKNNQETRNNNQINSKFQTPNFEQTRFVCSSEIACIYSKGGKVRRLHIVVLAPSLEAVEKINKELGKIGNLKADGRPILGLDVEKLAEIVLGVDERCMVIPAHIWTPWFAMFGSKSGFDSVEECWGQMSNNIFAIETGLSSDPQMNWRVKNLDRMSIISNSDAHSLPNIGREANVLEIPPLSFPLAKGGTKGGLSYDEIIKIIRGKNIKDPARNGAGFLQTIEFYPEEGMYHFDGHRACRISMMPGEAKQNKNICPRCKKILTIGVLNRVEELAEKNRDDKYVDNSRPSFVKLVELDKIIAESLGIKSRSAGRVKAEYDNLIKKFGNEFEILLKVKTEKIAESGWLEIAEGIQRVREGRVMIEPGFDGQYGKIKIFGKEKNVKKQMSLFG